ncbi:MAG: antibiotic biosynthesis monooxygenase [Pseudomonadales bacterium]|nr:antibiotic biosynthesis monooxygenase [Pseudomonadales bacterium]
MINLTAKFHAKKGQEASLEALLSGMLTPTRNESGCIGYRLFNDQDNPNIFIFQEEFADQHAFDDHCQQPHFTSLLEQLEGLLEQEPEICLLSPLENKR